MEEGFLHGYCTWRRINHTLYLRCLGGVIPLTRVYAIYNPAFIISFRKCFQDLPLSISLKIVQDSTHYLSFFVCLPNRLFLALL